MEDFKEEFITGGSSSELQRNCDALKHLRKVVGMKEHVPRLRNCLRCEKEFTSYGPSNRMCGCTKDSIEH